MSERNEQIERVVPLTAATPRIGADPVIASVAETAKARVQAMYVMALQKPRDVDQARDNILRACRRPGFAERVEFNKPVGGGMIKGPSVRFAELALREYGNVLTDTQVIYEDENLRRIKLFVTDLESNTTHSKELVIGKTVERKSPQDRQVIGDRMNTQGDKVYIVRPTEDELHNKEAALISKALRNEGLRLIPSDIVDEGIEVARKTLKDRDAKDPDSAKKAVLDSFSEIGVRPKDIEQYLKHKVDTLTPAEMQDLRGIYRAIKDGETTWRDCIAPSGVEEKTLSKAQVLKDKLKEKRDSKKGQDKKEETGKEEPAKGEPEKASQDQAGEGNDELKVCPDRQDDLISPMFCNSSCKKRNGCPAWE